MATPSRPHRRTCAVRGTPRTKFKIILILSLAFGLVGLDRFILPVLFPSMMGELKLTYEDLGNLVGILAVAWGIAAFGWATCPIALAGGRC